MGRLFLYREGPTQSDRKVAYENLMGII